MKKNKARCNECEKIGDAICDCLNKLGDNTEDYKFDQVNHPSHYCKPGEVECIDQMIIIFGKAATIYFCELNAYKYLTRYADKGNPKQDLQKAIWYINRMALLLDPSGTRKVYCNVFDKDELTIDKIHISEQDTYQKCVFMAKNYLTNASRYIDDAYFAICDCKNAINAIERGIDLLEKEKEC